MRKMTLEDFINSHHIINKETDNLPDENNKFNPDISTNLFNKLQFGHGLIIDENNFIIFSIDYDFNFNESVNIDLFVFSNKENAISLIKRLEKCRIYKMNKSYDSKEYNWNQIKIEYLFNNSNFIEKMLVLESLDYEKVKYKFCDSDYDVSKFIMRKTIENKPKDSLDKLIDKQNKLFTKIKDTSNVHIKYDNVIKNKSVINRIRDLFVNKNAKN